MEFFYLDLHCPLISGRCNGRELTTATPQISDGIFDGIFPIVHRTFLLSCFEAAGSWIFLCSKYSCMWTYNEAAIELEADVFFQTITTAWP